MSGRAKLEPQIMDKLERDGENITYTRSVQEMQGQLLLNIPVRARENMGVEKSDELVVEVFGNGYAVYPPEGDNGD